MYKRLHYFLFILFLSLPAFVYSVNLLPIKGLVNSALYFTFYLTFILLPIAFIRPYLWGIFAAPFLLLVPAELIHIMHYDGYSTLSAITSSIETNHHEFAEFISNYRHYFLTLLPVALLLIYGHYFLADRAYKIDKKYRVAIVALFIALVSAFSYNTVFNSNNTNSASTNLSMLYKRLFTQNFPYSYIPKIYNYANHKIEFKQAMAAKSDFAFNAKVENQSHFNEHKPVHVLVIGETSRAANWSLGGYDRNTNPLLSDRTDIAYCNDAIAAATHTRESIQLALTRATPHDLSPIVNEKSLISAYSEAGFKTIWISNQNMAGRVDTPVFTIAKESHITHFIGGDYEKSSKYDEELIPILENELATNNDVPLFIVIHTMGSHEIYRMRHPESYEIFKPASKGDDYNWNSPGIRERLLNSYDNSILYTDYILDSFISVLENQSRNISFLYFSDHGENILDDGTQRFGHGGVIPTKYVTDIPLFFWFSNKFRTNYGKNVTQIQRNCELAVSTNYIFDTMLDLAAIRIPGHDSQKSLAGSAFKNAPRHILNTSKEPLRYDDIK